MFRISRLQEIIKPLGRSVFERLVRQHQADKYSKGFGSWEQLVAMIYGQLSGASSLRVLEAGYNGQENHHYHLGVRSVRRSTLSDANAHRSPAVFAEAVRVLMGQARRRLRREADEVLYLLDSTSLTLKGRGFDSWTQANRTRHTQGVKLHVLYDARAEYPEQASLTMANVNDRDEGVKLPLEPGATYVFDKAYYDYTWWHRIDQHKACFVTRFKRNVALRVTHERPVPGQHQAIVLKDELVCFANKHPRGGRKNPYRHPLRRITVFREQKEPLILATNDLTSPAITIAQHYKTRWDIEHFFKWVKQHLKIKTFLGRSENAVRIQILTALITYLLLALYRQASRFTGTLWEFFAEVRATLFQRPSLEFLTRRRQNEQRLAFLQLQLSLL